MYCSHFGLQRLPFNNTPDPSFYYSTPDHEEALATLQYATQQRRGFVLVTGEIGAGKTLIGRIFLRQMDTNSTTAVISQTHLTGRQLLAAICSEFGLPAPAEATNLELTQTLQDFLVEQFARNRFVVVLLDEAQNLPDESFEELRMLGNLEADDAKLLQVCILGQPELRERFRKPNMKQLDQRLFRRFHLPSLSRQQTGEYILHRLGVSGCKDENLFTQDAIERIFAASGGIPRLINQICDNALLTAYGQDKMQVDAKVIDVVLERDASLILQAPIGSTSERQFAPGGLHAGKDSFPMSAESIRLAELALDQTNELRRELDAISEASSTGPVREEIEKISQRQGELHKIVAGATTRWLAAKEKLDEYRKEIQSEIREVIVRCHRTQERLEEMERSAAPVEDLEEIRENHLRETNRLLGLMQTQRNDFSGQLEQLQKRWSESEQELRELASRNQVGDQIEAVHGKCETATREMLGALDEHRCNILEQIGQLRQQCDNAHLQLRTIDADFQRRCLDADRRVEELRSNCNQQQEEVVALRRQLDESRTAIQVELGALNERMGQLSQAASASPRQREEHRRLREQLSSLAEELHRQHQVTTAELQRKIEEQMGALQTLRRSVDQAAGESDRLHSRAVEQVATRTSQLEYQVENLVKEVRETDLRWTQEFRKLSETLASADDVEKLHRRQREQASAVDALQERSQSADRRLDAVGERQQGIENQVHALSEQSQTTRQKLEAVGQRGDFIEQRMDALGQVSELQKQAVAELASRVNEQRRLLESECQSLALRGQQMQTEFDRLASCVAQNQDLEDLRHAHAEAYKRMENALAMRSAELDQLGRRLEEWTHRVAGQLDELRSTTARPEEVCALRDALAREAASLSDALNANVARWQQMSTELGDQTARHATALRDLSSRTENLERETAALRDRSEKSATREEVEAVSKRHVQLQARVMQQLHDVRGEQLAGLDRVRGELDTLGAEAIQRQAELTERLSAAQASTIAQLTARQETQRLETLQTIDSVRDQVRTTDQASCVRDAELLGTIEGLRGEVQTTKQELVKRDAELSDQVTATQAVVSQLGSIQEQQRAELMQTLDRARGQIEAQLKQLSDDISVETARSEQSKVQLAERIEEVRSDASEQRSAVVAAIDRVRLTLESQLNEVTSRFSTNCTELERGQSDLVERIKQVRTGASDQLMKACDSQRSEMMSTIQQVRDLLQTQLGNIALELASAGTKTREGQERLQASIDGVRTQAAQRISQVQESQARGDKQLEERIEMGELQRSADVAELNRRWEALRSDLEQLERTAAPSETLTQVQESLTANVSDVRHQLAMTNSTHALRLKTLVDKVQETAARVAYMEREASPYRINMKPEVMNELGNLVTTAHTERESLTHELERAHAVSAHFRNTSSQVQEIMEDWTRQSGDVREQADALRSSAEAAKTILEAMKRCNTALDSKINSQRWTSELERGEALVSRLEQVISSGRLTAGRLESLLGDFDARRSEAEEWERRHAEVVKAAERLEQLLGQSREAGQEVEKAVASRQRLIAAMARNANQLAEAIRSARIEDEIERPTPMPPPAEPAPAPAPKKPTPAVKPSVPTSAKPAPRTSETETSRIAWPRVPAPLIAARR